LQFNSTVASDASLTEATGARAEHPLVPRRYSARQQAGGVDNNIRNQTFKCRRHSPAPPLYPRLVKNT